MINTLYLLATYNGIAMYKCINLPNSITLVRILAIPLFVFIFYLPVTNAHLIAACIFALAAITDILDGYLARTLHQTSGFGRFLDPVADKLLVATGLILIVAEPSMPYLTIPAAIIIGREITVSALREWMAEVGKRSSVAVSYMAKCKATIQMIAITILLALTPGSQKFLVLTSYLLIYLATILTLWSMAHYLRQAWIELNGKYNE